VRSCWSKLRWRLAILRQPQSPGELFLFLRIALFALAVPALMRLKLPRLERLLEPARTPPPPAPARVQAIIDYVNAAIRAGRPLIRPTCLTRGVTAYTFLRRAGLDVTLCFGIGTVGSTAPGASVAAHCWLAVDGEPFMEARDPRPLYATMYEFHRDRPAGRDPLAS
jgi:hypothetical protein